MNTAEKIKKISLFKKHRTFERLEIIYKYFHYLYKSKTHKLCFNSDKGQREIELTRKGFFFPKYILSYADYAGVVVFKIEVSAHTLSVSPMLGGYGLTGHDIDLAILEVENYLRDTYNDFFDEHVSKKDKEKIRLYQHRAELEYLEK